MKFKIEDAQFILDELPLSEEQRASLSVFIELKNPINILIAEQLRDLCTEQLARRGFDEKYQPNQLGRRLEDIIDKLFVN